MRVSAHSPRRRCCRVCIDPQRSGAPVACAKCRLAHYCSKAHRAADAAQHSPLCRTLSTLRQQLTKHERGLRGELREYVGLYWGFYEARDFLRTKMQIMELCATLGSREALATALGEGLDLLRLSRADPMAVRYVVPSLYLRLDRVQECYDFVKWWVLALKDESYSFRDMEMPFLDLVGADVTEPLAFLEVLSLPHCIALVVVKLRVLRTIWEGLQAERISIERLLPVPIARAIQDFVGCSRPHQNQSVRQLHNEIQRQTVELIKRTHDLNAHLWELAVEPEKGKRVPDGFTGGSKDEARVMLSVWMELVQDAPGFCAAVRSSGVSTR